MSTVYYNIVKSVNLMCLFLIIIKRIGLKEKPTPSFDDDKSAVTRIRTWVTSATTKGTNHYTITANYQQLKVLTCSKRMVAAYEGPWELRGDDCNGDEWHCHLLA